MDVAHRDLSGAEAVAASALSCVAAPIVAGYLLDRAGLPIAPIPLLIVALASAAGTGLWLSKRAVMRRGELLAFAAIVLTTLAGLAWLARPNLLPIGTGPDLTHHLLLIQFIERHWRLVHDTAVEAYLGEMVQYTPGSHILAALGGAWTGTDGFHAVHSVVAASVALKAGFVFLIALRLLPKGVPRIPLALTSVALLLAPQSYVVGSFTRDSFLAQVVSELFAVAMWWALVVWDEEPSRGAVALFALAGAAAFLTWPVWTAAPVAALLVAVAWRDRVRPGERLTYLVIGCAPIAAIAVMYLAGRLGWLGMVRTDGVVLRPLPREFGWWFLALSSGGLIVAATTRRGRTTALMAGAIGLEALALYWVARTRSAETPYLALKMFYLAIYPQAVAGALALATAWQFIARTLGARARSGPFRELAAMCLAWALVAVIAVRSAGWVLAERPRPIVSESLHVAGNWAREHVPAACVDYLVGDDFTAYWLHLAVLGNPRMSSRTGNDDTYSRRAAIVRWLTPDGFPYAIAELGALPRDVRADLDVVADFGSAAVVKRRGPALCAE